MAALIAASVALKTFEDDFAPVIKEINEASYVPEDLKYKSRKILKEIRGSTSFVIAITAVSIMIEAAVILTRFLNIEFVNGIIITLLPVVSLTS